MPTITVPLQEIARPPIRQITVGAGLCRTCVQAAECTFPRDPNRPVRSCDEFEGADGPRSDHIPRIVAASVFPLGGRPEKGATEVKGLCVQCARRHTCAYPKPAGGVWHCDELA
ncbi:MAG: hypothetical protein A2Z31_07100 [candidate division NC10 bacterium RBG_16_65_8]|nr:MAG: hypothetical protein A2Z31_07100 [candidate division NC10 bacterium RBG_16_65_8]